MTAEQTLIALLLNRVAELETQVKYEVTVIAVDIAGLGEINRLQGHDKGDLLLCRVADDLKLSVRLTDCLYRRGGDEFVMILPHCSYLDADKVESRVRSLSYDLYIGVVSGKQQLSVLIQAAFSQVECQKNRRRSGKS